MRAVAEGLGHAFAAAFHTARAPMLITDACAKDNPILFVNDAFRDFTGSLREEILGRTTVRHRCRLAARLS